MGRRAFLIGLALCATFAGAKAIAETAVSVPTGEPDLKFGVLSDIHLLKPGDEDTFIKALTHFRTRNVDAVVIAGDIADRGHISEMKICADAWEKVFPGNRRKDGQVVEKIFVSGNHEREGWMWGKKKEELEDPDYKADCIQGEGWNKAWAVIGEKYEPIFMKTVKGYRFVGAHYFGVGRMAEFIRQHARELSGPKPFFYVQHQHLKNTCIGPWAWGRDNGKSTEVLSAFPNAVAFSGHSHYSLTDERSVWQGAFTSINTSSLKYTDLAMSLRENLGGNPHGYQGENRRHAMKQMPNTEVYKCRQGMVVSVYGTTLVIERREFVTDKSLGPDWVLRIPGGPDATNAARKARRSAPAFAEGAKVTAEVADSQVTVSFPAANTVNNCRVFDYEVTAQLLEDDVDLVIAQRRVIAEDFFLPDASPNGAPGKCVFDRSELRSYGHYVFSVRPVECFGNKGRTIRSDLVELKKPAVKPAGKR